MPQQALAPLIADVPAGRWAVGVSGGADSVALLLLLRWHRRPADDLSLHVVHLDHQTRGDASAADAAFVADLAARWGLSCTIARRDEVEPGTAGLPANPSARYRALRHETFRRAVAANDLQGVLLAHHGDDQAETVLQRLLRGSGPAGLAGMSARSVVGGLTILRPLLAARREPLRRLLAECGQPWREDASNASDRYLRNRLRLLLARQPSLTVDLLALSEACREARDWVRRHAPDLGETFPAARLRQLPEPLARESARRWLLSRGVPPAALDRSPAAIGRLIALSADAGISPRLDLPGGVRACRRGGLVRAEREPG